MEAAHIGLMNPLLRTLLMFLVALLPGGLLLLPVMLRWRTRRELPATSPVAAEPA